MAQKMFSGKREPEFREHQVAVEEIAAVFGATVPAVADRAIELELPIERDWADRPSVCESDAYTLARSLRGRPLIDPSLAAAQRAEAAQAADWAAFGSRRVFNSREQRWESALTRPGDRRDEEEVR
jgi:hypothetical protein